MTSSLLIFTFNNYIFYLISFKIYFILGSVTQIDCNLQKYWPKKFINLILLASCNTKFEAENPKWFKVQSLHDVKDKLTYWCNTHVRPTSSASESGGFKHPILHLRSSTFSKSMWHLIYNTLTSWEY